MRNGYTLRILNEGNHGSIPANHQLLPQDQIDLGGWDQKGVVYYELLKPGETVNAYRYHQQLIKLRRTLREKKARL